MFNKQLEMFTDVNFNNVDKICVLQGFKYLNIISLNICVHFNVFPHTYIIIIILYYYIALLRTYPPLNHCSRCPESIIVYLYSICLHSHGKIDDSGH